MFCFGKVKECVSMTGGGRGVFFEDENDHIFALGVIKRERNRKLLFLPDKVTSVVKR